MLEESLPDSCHTIKDVTQNMMNLTKIVGAEKELNRLHIVETSAEMDSARSYHKY